MCLNECNRVLYLLYRCPVQYSGGAGRPKLAITKLAITKNQLEYLIDNDLSAKDISSMLNISVRTVHHRFQEFELSIRASYVIW
jgi:AraC-like DNA-binding protein